MQILKRPKFKMMMAILLLLVIEGAIYIAYTMYTNKQVLLLQHEIKSKEAQQVDLSYYSENKIKINQQIVEMESEINRLGVLIPDHDCINEVSQDLFNMIKSKKYKIDKMNINFAEDKDKLNIIRLNIETIGSPKDITDIMKYFDNYKREVAVKNFRIQSGPDNSYIASINVEIYYFNS